MAISASSRFVRRLEHGADLSDGDRAALAHLVRNARHVGARRVLAGEGDPSPRMLVVLEGWACRCKVLAAGKRQITDLMLPGDACHPHTALLGRADHAIETLTSCTVAEVDPAELVALLGSRPGAARALWWSALQVDSMLRTALTNNGRRRADPRLAHLVCEVAARLRAVGLVERGGEGGSGEGGSGEGGAGESFAWPLTQEEIGEITSLTSVHVNRTLRTMRGAGLLALDGRTMRVPDPARLAASCGFRPDYLHLAPRVGAVAA